MTFTGRFPGQCGECGEQTKGTEVEYNLSNEIVHVICPDTFGGPPRPVCPRCFLELPAAGDACEDCS